MFTLLEPVSQEQLSQCAERITQLFSGTDANEIRARRAILTGLDQDVVDWMLQTLTQSDLALSGEVYMDGLTNVLAEPEFIGSEEARRALRVLEERTLLQDLVARTVFNTAQGDVQVLIGGEGTWVELRQWSIVLGSYGMPGLATGTLGVLGPMRMSYGRAISTVRFISGILSDLVAETLVEDSSVT